MNEQQNNEYIKAHSSKRHSGRKMNFIDWLLVLIVIACVGAFVYFAFFSELGLFGSKEDKVSVQYTVKIENVNAFIEINPDEYSNIKKFLFTLNELKDNDYNMTEPDNK